VCWKKKEERKEEEKINKKTENIVL